jgi:hypothetical protein
MDNYSPDPGSAGSPGSSGPVLSAANGPSSSGAAASGKHDGIQRADGTPVRVLVVDD